MLGELVVPVLRREFAKGRPADVPEAPVHPRVARRLATGPGATAADPSGDESEGSPEASRALETTAVVA